jgi:3'(2'), 5'-bisphosphate nucleotidase
MIDQICQMATDAGDIILRYYKGSIQVTAKADNSPLSEADRASHDYLTRALQQLAPEWPVISEESSEERPTVEGLERYWLVDPLDGTKEFLKGTDEFTVNIALIESGRPILGVVVAPALSLTYYGARSAGSWKRTRGREATPIHTRPADRTRMGIVASKDHAGPQVARLLANIPGAELKSMGSSLKFCLVAEGAADLYLRDLPTMEWDTAAAQCVVEAAGGAICDLAANPLGYGKKDLKNPAIITLGDMRFDWKPLLE